MRTTVTIKMGKNKYTYVAKEGEILIALPSGGVEIFSHGGKVGPERDVTIHLRRARLKISR